MHGTDLEIIKKLDVFNSLPSEELDEMASLMYVMPVLEGEKLIQAGDAATHFYVSLSGSYMLHDEGGKALTIHDRGHVVGEAAVLGAPFHPISVTALTNGSVLVVPWEELQPVMEHHFESDQKIAVEINKMVSARQDIFDISHSP